MDAFRLSTMSSVTMINAYLGLTKGEKKDLAEFVKSL